VALQPHERDDPDITLRAYLAWCSRQPASLGASCRSLLARTP
jgi:hypothetical protein